GHRSGLHRALASAPCTIDTLYAARRLVPQPGRGGRQFGIVGEMKSERDDRLGARGVLRQPRECSLERLKTPEIVGQVDNPVLETIGRLWWQSFNHVCYCFLLIRLSIFDRICRP